MDWPLGGGEMGERMRRHDWDSTSLGCAKRWPQSLTTAVAERRPVGSRGLLAGKSSHSITECGTIRVISLAIGAATREPKPLGRANRRRVTDPDITACVRDGLPAIDTQPTSDPEEPFARPLVCAARGEEPFACHGIRPAWYLTRSDSTDPRVLGPYGVCH
jgi:hypothetical protein